MQRVFYLALYKVYLFEPWQKDSQPASHDLSYTRHVAILEELNWLVLWKDPSNVGATKVPFKPLCENRLHKSHKSAVSGYKDAKGACKRELAGLSKGTCQVQLMQWPGKRAVKVHAKVQWNLASWRSMAVVAYSGLYDCLQAAQVGRFAESFRLALVDY